MSSGVPRWNKPVGTRLYNSESSGSVVLSCLCISLSQERQVSWWGRGLWKHGTESHGREVESWSYSFIVFNQSNCAATSESDAHL